MVFPTPGTQLYLIPAPMPLVLVLFMKSEFIDKSYRHFVIFRRVTAIQLIQSMYALTRSNINASNDATLFVEHKVYQVEKSTSRINC